MGVRFILCLCLTIAAAGCAAHNRPPQRPAPSPVPPSAAAAPIDTVHGLASYYGEDFHGRITASGVRFDMHAMVAAHPTFPFGTIVRVTNMANGRRVTVRIIDRGPGPSARADGVVIDLSQRAAASLGFIPQGRARVRIDVLKWGR